MTARHLLFPLFLAVSIPSAIYVFNRTAKADEISPRKPATLSKVAGVNIPELHAKAIEARDYVAKNGFNTSICFLIDMSRPSGSNRFYVYDLGKDSILKSGLVAHGRCNEEWLEGRKFGNTVGCGCSSLGKYRVGYSYNGRFGEAFKLFGLDSTNDKAFERFVVLHSYECVPTGETSEEICQSDGCPMVAPAYLRQLKPIIKGSAKPLLLWIYN
jgi:hypothetical protein